MAAFEAGIVFVFVVGGMVFIIICQNAFGWGWGGGGGRFVKWTPYHTLIGKVWAVYSYLFRLSHERVSYRSDSHRLTTPEASCRWRLGSWIAAFADFCVKLYVGPQLRVPKTCSPAAQHGT